MHEILRTGTGPDFTYVTKSGSKVTSKAILEYIKSLHIPPAYVNVHIYASEKGSSICEPIKLTYTGIDTKGRKQYGYAAAFRKRSAKAKFTDLIAFGLALPKIRSRITEILKNIQVSRNPSIEVAIALILRIVLLCHFRLGNEKYKRLYKSYGVSTLEVRHLKFVSPTATSRIKVPCAKFSFIGKKGVKNDCCICEPDVIAHLMNISAGKSPRDPIFAAGDGTPVKATDINTWLRQFGVDLSSKQFRTFAGSTMLIHMLNAHAHRNKKVEMPESLSVTERKRAINAALDITSETIHNTRAVCKREYCHSSIVELYLNHPRKYASIFMRHGVDAEKMFMDFLINEEAGSRGGNPRDDDHREEDKFDASDFWVD